jgi:hypothetical protein
MATIKKALKTVDKSKKPGLAKLPTEVRNKMGYQQAGGKTPVKKVSGEMTGKMYKKSEIDAIGKKQAAELDKSGVFGKAAMAKKKAPKAQDGLRTGQYKRLGRIDEKNPARAERVADRMKTKASRVERGMGVANPPMMRMERFDMDKKLRESKMAKGGMLKRADGSYSKRGLWDNLRSKAAKNKANGAKPKAPSKAMLSQEKKIKAKGK